MFNMHKNILIKTTASAVAGGIVYGSVVALLNYFAPIIGVVAGFAGGFGLVILSAHYEENKNDISIVDVLYFSWVAILSLLIGYVSIYYLKAEIIHSMTFHPKDISTFSDFIANTFGMPDMFSTILGGVAAYALSDKIRAFIRGISSWCHQYD